jgi:hypothetical protein
VVVLLRLGSWLPLLAPRLLFVFGSGPVACRRPCPFPLILERFDPCGYGALTLWLFETLKKVLESHYFFAIVIKKVVKATAMAFAHAFRFLFALNCFGYALNKSGSKNL